MRVEASPSLGNAALFRLSIRTVSRSRAKRAIDLKQSCLHAISGSNNECLCESHEFQINCSTVATNLCFRARCHQSVARRRHRCCCCHGCCLRAPCACLSPPLLSQKRWQRPQSDRARVGKWRPARPAAASRSCRMLTGICVERLRDCVRCREGVRCPASEEPRER